MGQQRPSGVRPLNRSMEDEATVEDKELLSSIRGSFGPSSWTIVGNRTITYLFLVGMPLFLLSIRFTAEAIDSDDWILFPLVLGSAGLGYFCWRFTGHRYDFDGSVVRQIFRIGKLWKQIRIDEVVAITMDLDSSPPSFLIQTERSKMGIILYPDLRAEIKKHSNQSVQTTPTRSAALRV